MRPAYLLQQSTAPVFFLSVLTAALALLLGGGTKSGFAGDAILQIAAIPLLIVALNDCLRHRDGFTWLEVLICGLILAVPLAQCIDLPPYIWQQLPLRDLYSESLEFSRGAVGWAPISLNAPNTALAALSLIPPIALFLGVRQLDFREKRDLVTVVLVIAGASVFLGIAQVATGDESPLRFFEVTNPTEAVGFFANRNHFSAFLYVAMTFAAVWVLNSGFALIDARDRQSRHYIVLTATATLMFLLASTQIIARSRGGAALTVVALIGIGGMMIADPRNVARKTSIALLLIGAVAVLVFSAQFGLSRFADRDLTFHLQTDTRFLFARNTLGVAQQFLPFGSGIGSFPEVYATIEKSNQLMINGVANHAHNDFLELWLEAGVAGGCVLALLALWTGWRAVQVWVYPNRTGRAFDTLLARAATLVILLLALHSFVDYPLHTSALCCLFAISCALIASPRREQELFQPLLAGRRGSQLVRMGS